MPSPACQAPNALRPGAAAPSAVATPSVVKLQRAFSCIPASAAKGGGGAGPAGRAPGCRRARERHRVRVGWHRPRARRAWLAGRAARARAAARRAVGARAAACARTRGLPPPAARCARRRAAPCAPCPTLVRPARTARERGWSRPGGAPHRCRRPWAPYKYVSSAPSTQGGVDAGHGHALITGPGGRAKIGRAAARSAHTAHRRVRTG